MKRRLIFVEIAWHAKLEDRSGGIPGETERSTVGLGSSPGYRQPESRPLLWKHYASASGRVPAEEAGEQVIDQIGGNPGALVLDAEQV